MMNEDILVNTLCSILTRLNVKIFENGSLILIIVFSSSNRQSDKLSNFAVWACYVRDRAVLAQLLNESRVII